MTVMSKNMPRIKLGVVGVSRDCFPVELTRARLAALMPEIAKTGVSAHACSIILESEDNVLPVLRELSDNGVNALFVYLGNFGPEGPTTILMQRFPGPCMVAGAAEESRQSIAGNRGDALCGLLSNSYNLHIRGVRAHIPQFPIGTPRELAEDAAHFASVARVVAGVKNLKIFVFGPRPQEFITCHAPLKPLFNMGVEVMENSELDMLVEFKAAAGEKDMIESIRQSMVRDFAGNVSYPDLLPRLAQFETALLKFKDRHLGVSSFAAFANKCWPAFEPEFGFQPCYVNSRITGQGFPVACEVDIYGALSEYMAMCAADHPVTLLDVNNSVPDDMLPAGTDLKGAEKRDLFMGFHCGNTCAACMKTCEMKYNFMLQRGMPEGSEPDISRGTLEGQLRPGEITWFRLQATPENHLMSYVAEGDVLDIDPATFGGTGIFAVPGFARFYRHVLVGKGFPHHAALTYGRAGEVLCDAAKLLGIDDIGVPLPGGVPYPGENLYAWARTRKDK